MKFYIHVYSQILSILSRIMMIPINQYFSGEATNRYWTFMGISGYIRISTNAAIGIPIDSGYSWLVGGLEHEIYCSLIIFGEFHHPN